MGSRDGAVVRALASHQCVQGLIPGPGVICELLLCLILVLTLRVFLWVLWFSFLLKKKKRILTTQRDAAIMQQGHNKDYYRD